ncbi:hypothetical protein N7532_004576 [Penicillium argentinense]|uniref:Uncharacterized protein n=1 Tax=Penicillium argentinense TaxID=1131581 RepID=A0A9W9FQ46_9EURO|nr:uncharacterized protein N7532_004576 [Penicillium argentinense]KAJ5104047.1 hypothetical protein N7532_004576 [Penicillium argentinense]
MASTQISELLRFLSKDAKVPLAMAMAKTPELQKANLTNAEQISKTEIQSLEDIFKDKKVAKQVLNASKRACKKRAASPNTTPSSPKRPKSIDIRTETKPFEIEYSLRLLMPPADENKLQQIKVVTNRAPLVLAFAVGVLKYTMPEQPISSRLSLAQAVVSANSRAKAVSLGIENGQSAEEEGWGEGHPVLKVLGREIRVLKRWDYDPWHDKPSNISGAKKEVPSTIDFEDFLGRANVGSTETMPPLWGVDLEALRGSRGNSSTEAPRTNSTLPIFRPESARSYLLKAVTKSPESGSSSKPKRGAALQQESEEHVGYLLRAIDMVCSSWASDSDKEELDRRAWACYLRVRPDVQSGTRGWGEKGQVCLSDILKLRKGQ